MNTIIIYMAIVCFYVSLPGYSAGPSSSLEDKVNKFLNHEIEAYPYDEVDHIHKDGATYRSFYVEELQRFITAAEFPTWTRQRIDKLKTDFPNLAINNLSLFKQSTLHVSDSQQGTTTASVTNIAGLFSVLDILTDVNLRTMAKSEPLVAKSIKKAKKEIDNIVSFFPVRSMLPNYKKFIHEDKWDGNYRPKLNTCAQTLDKIATDPDFLEQINILTRLDQASPKSMDESEIIEIKNLIECIHAADEKPQGRLYALKIMSPIELFKMVWKRKFYLPEFTIAQIANEPEEVNFEALTSADLNAQSRGVETPLNRANVLFEIDTSEFNAFSMALSKNGDTKNRQALLTPYNVFEFTGFKTADVAGKIILVLQFKVKNYFMETDFEKYCLTTRPEITAEVSSALSRWMVKKGAVHSTRRHTAQGLLFNFIELIFSYERISLFNQWPIETFESKKGVGLHVVNMLTSDKFLRDLTNVPQKLNPFTRNPMPKHYLCIRRNDGTPLWINFLDIPHNFRELHLDQALSYLSVKDFVWAPEFSFVHNPASLLDLMSAEQLPRVSIPEGATDQQKDEFMAQVVVDKIYQEPRLERTTFINSGF